MEQYLFNSQRASSATSSGNTTDDGALSSDDEEAPLSQPRTTPTASATATAMTPTPWRRRPSAPSDSRGVTLDGVGHGDRSAQGDICLRFLDGAELSIDCSATHLSYSHAPNGNAEVYSLRNDARTAARPLPPYVCERMRHVPTLIDALSGCA